MVPLVTATFVVTTATRRATWPANAQLRFEGHGHALATPSE